MTAEWEWIILVFPGKVLPNSLIPMGQPLKFLDASNTEWTLEVVQGKGSVCTRVEITIIFKEEVMNLSEIGGTRGISGWRRMGVNYAILQKDHLKMFKATIEKNYHYKYFPNISVLEHLKGLGSAITNFYYFRLIFLVT